MAALSTAAASGFEASTRAAAPRAANRLGGPVVPHRRERRRVRRHAREAARRQDGHIDWVFPSHADYDGLGGFVHRAARGLSRIATSRCRCARAARLAGQARRGTAAMVAQKPVPAAAWKGYDANWSGRRPPMPAANSPPCSSRTDVTRRLNATARASGVSLNSLLMHTLAQGEPARPRGRPRLVDDARQHARAGEARRATPPTRPATCRSRSPTTRRSATSRISSSSPCAGATIGPPGLFLNISQLVGYAGIRHISSSR